MDLNDFHGLKIERLVSVCISSYHIEVTNDDLDGR
jgi:hypothetical protein